MTHDIIFASERITPETFLSVMQLLHQRWSACVFWLQSFI